MIGKPTFAAMLAIACSTVAAGESDATRPTILMNRWQEDWSTLVDARLRTGPLDALKYIPLSSTDPKTYLSLGGSLRERFESNEAPLFGTVAGRADSYLISRLEAHADLHVGPLQTFVQLQSDFSPGKNLKSPVDSDRLDLEQAFVALVEPVGPGLLKLRAGRQQFAFDLQRFVSLRDGPNVRQSFDAVWADYESGPWRVIGYYSQPVANRDVRAFDDVSSGRNRFYGARIERHVLGTNELSAYWSRFTNDDANFLSARGRERRDVWDARFAGRDGAFDWDLEGMVQSGRVGTQRVRAWALGSRAGYTFEGLALRPRVGVQVDAASGDHDPGDRRIETFNPLFPNGYYLALAGYTGYVNFVHAKPSLTLQPLAGLAVTGSVAAQWRETTADAVYTQPSVAVPRTAGRGSRWTGVYEQLRADWKASANLTASLEAVHFTVGQTIRDAGGHDGNYVGLEFKYAW